MNNIKCGTISYNFLIIVCYANRSSCILSIFQASSLFLTLSFFIHFLWHLHSFPLISEMWSAKDNRVHRERTTNHTVFINPPPHFSHSPHLVTGLVTEFEKNVGALIPPAFLAQYIILFWL